VERDRIVDLGLDLALDQIGEQPITIVRLEHVQVEDVALVG
jgi:hypothetical protein